MEALFDIESGKIAILCEPNNDYRKLIHMLMLNKGKLNWHRSFVNNNIACENCRSYTYYRCYECNAKTSLDTFVPQSSPQISKSYMYYGRCIKCGEDLMYDVGDYDISDFIDNHREQRDGPCGNKFWSGNNIMVFGVYIQKYFRKELKKSGLEIASEELDEFMETAREYLKTKKIYVIDAPEKPMSKAEFMEYITTKI
jgi:hypothetical protein